MKTYRTNKATIAAFLNGATDGHNPNQTLFIEGDTLYSYGKHYALAKRQNNGVSVNRERYYFNEKQFSRATIKQASQVISEAIKAKIEIF
jgi:hypothetical protein